MLAQQLVVTRQERLEQVAVCRSPSIAKRDERVPPQIGRVVLRHVESLVASTQLVRLPPQPVHKRHMRFGPVRGLTPGTSLLDTAVPRTDVLTDVAAVHLRTELGAILGR